MHQPGSQLLGWCSFWAMKFKRKQNRSYYLMFLDWLCIGCTGISCNVDSAQEWTEKSKNEVSLAALHVTFQSLLKSCLRTLGDGGYRTPKICLVHGLVLAVVWWFWFCFLLGRRNIFLLLETSWWFSLHSFQLLTLAMIDIQIFKVHQLSFQSAEHEDWDDSSLRWLICGIWVWFGFYFCLAMKRWNNWLYI